MTKNKKGKCVQINDIDPEIFKLFKIACIRRDLDMRTVLIQYIQEVGASEKK